MTTGFEYKNNQLQIDKDPEASLIYTFDWSEWLDTNDYIETAVFQIQARINDPRPLLNVSHGIINGNQTYIQLDHGQLYKVYTVEIKITTHTGLIERRNFKVNITTKSV